MVDSGTGTVFGPYTNGTNIKYTEANGATPSASPGPGAVEWRIKGRATCRSAPWMAPATSRRRCSAWSRRRPSRPANEFWKPWEPRLHGFQFVHFDLRSAITDAIHRPSMSPARDRTIVNGAIISSSSPSLRRNAGLRGWPRSACRVVNVS